MSGMDMLAVQEFNQYAGDYDRLLERGLIVSGEGREYFAQGRVDWLRACTNELGVAPRRIMDYGCGTGMTTELLHQRFAAELVVGIDLSSRLIERAKREYGTQQIQFSHIPQYRPNMQMDLAYCNGVFHHIPVSLRDEAVRYIWDSLTVGGYFALWENNPWNPGTRYVMSRVSFDRDAVALTASESCDLLQRAGFHIVRTNYLFIFPRFLSAFRCLEKYVCDIPLGGQYLVLARKSGNPGRTAGA